MTQAATNRVILITGAGGGLGVACVETLARRGFRVVAADLDDAAATAATTTVADTGAVGIGLDVTSSDAVDAAVRDIVQRFGSLDGVVNLAGVARNQMLHKVDDAAWDLVMRTHVNGTLNTMRAGGAHMRKAGYGRIVNMSSIAIRGSLAGSAYGAAKGAIEALTRSAAIELAPFGVTANCVAPGVVSAGIFLTTPAEYQQERIERVPMRRAAQPAEIATTVAFFLSDDAAYITGQSLFVCGGLSIGI